MKIEDFQKHSHELVDWMFSYLKEIEKYPIKPDIKPGEIYNALPEKPPMNGEAFDKIFKDFNEIIIPGITHWQSPNFHAFFPANNSYPSILAEMLISTIGAQCMMWDTSPSATELEQKVTEWIRDSIGLPSNWSGVINDTASVGTICSLLTARENHSKFKINSDGFSNNKYKIYCSKETHSSIEKAVKIIGFGSKNLNKIDTDNNLSIDLKKLENQIIKDIESNYIPLAIISTYGTTGTVAFDSINEIALIAKKYKIWHHIDAAYAGSALFLDEYKKDINNIKYADSFLFNPHKWMLTNFDCSLYYVKDEEKLIKTLEIHPEYLKTSSKNIKNYKDWSIQLGRRFRALKLWFVIRSYGINGIKKYLKNHINLAKYLKDIILNDENFELTTKQNMNMINFRFNPKKSKNNSEINKLNIRLIDKLNKTGKIYLSHTMINNIYSIRMPIGSTTVGIENIKSSWKLIKKTSQNII
tara:strand:+ start:454 stop:1866 length:1413 start_codon:yes stop_codon:yes gene_type:complete